MTHVSRRDFGREMDGKRGKNGKTGFWVERRERGTGLSQSQRYRFATGTYLPPEHEVSHSANVLQRTGGTVRTRNRNLVETCGSKLFIQSIDGGDT
jgi:hypothetical protein